MNLIHLLSLFLQPLKRNVSLCADERELRQNAEYLARNPSTADKQREFYGVNEEKPSSSTVPSPAIGHSPSKTHLGEFFGAVEANASQRQSQERS